MIGIGATLSSTPTLLHAQSLGYPISFMTGVGDVVGILIPVAIALAFLVFVWGLIVFIARSGDESAQTEGKNKMIWGVFALFLITSIWGIIKVVQLMVGADSDTGNIQLQKVPKQ